MSLTPQSASRPLSRSVSRASIQYDLGPPLSNRILSQETVTFQPQDTSPYQSPASGSLILPQDFDYGRYIPYPPSTVHYEMPEDILEQYCFQPLGAERISKLFKDPNGKGNIRQRQARLIAQIVFKDKPASAEANRYLGEDHEPLVADTLELLDQLCYFKPKWVIREGEKFIPVVSYSNSPLYFKMRNKLLNLRASLPSEQRRIIGVPPEWPRETHSFDAKQFTVAAMLFRDKVTRYLASYLRNKPASSQSPVNLVSHP
ncbi:hypothetical protein RhiLY_12237 [Ceratobasidium sp. AG-Ba]|nr:hypothetical protein RhiLY_12237 [Ceratobasidium sp. AG-Ba]